MKNKNCKTIKGIILYFLRSKNFQPFWEYIFHYSKVGMNYWGGTTIGYSGEEFAIRYANKKFKNTSREILIFDVGANIGQFAQIALTEFTCKKIIHSFEPSQKTFYMLNNFIEKNYLFEKIITHNIGFGSDESDMMLYSSETASTIASLYDQQNPL